MVENVKLLRPYLVMLAIVTVGRWLLGPFFHVPYEKGTSLLSIVTLTIFASLFYGAFSRRWPGLRILQAVALTMTAAIIAQLVILLSTAASYLFGIESYFNHAVALNQPQAVPFGQAMLIRIGGLVANTLLNGIAGALGWALGALLPPSGASGAPKS